MAILDTDTDARAERGSAGEPTNGDQAISGVTQVLGQIASGDPSAAEQLLPLVYDELRGLARQRLAHEKPGQMLHGMCQ